MSLLDLPSPPAFLVTFDTKSHARVRACNSPGIDGSIKLILCGRARRPDPTMVSQNVQAQTLSFHLIRHASRATFSYIGEGFLMSLCDTSTSSEMTSHGCEASISRHRRCLYHVRKAFYITLHVVRHLFQLLSELLHTIAAIRLRVITVASPAAQAVSPPDRAPKNPCSATAFFTPWAIA